MNVYKTRLQNVIKALRESPEPRYFTMRKFGYECGTPACALGHYAVRTDLQDVFLLKKSEIYEPLVMFQSVSGLASVITHGGWDSLDSSLYLPVVSDHFGITDDEAGQLFGPYGCASAQTPDEAIAYIEGFIARKWPEDPAAQRLIDELNALQPQVQEAA